MAEPAHYAVREMRRDDRAYVFRSWLGTYSSASSVASMPSAQFYGVYHDVVERLLDDPGLEHVVLCDPRHDDHVLAFAVFGRLGDTPVVHYAHVRGTERGAGLFTALMSLAGVDGGTHLVYTFDTRDAGRLARNRYVNATFRPELQSGGGTGR